MSLLAEFLAIVQDWRSVFFRNVQRTFERGARQALGSLICLGTPLPDSYHLDQRRPEPQLERAEYFLHSRCQWEPQQLFCSRS